MRYTAKPIFKFFNNTIEALPTSSVTIPDTLFVEKTVNVKVGEPQTINFTGGWGDYSVSNSAPSVCSYTLTGKIIKISGLKKGTAILTLKDKRSNESEKIKVIVYETQEPPTIDVTPDEYDFGTIILGDSDSKTFTVNCANAILQGVSPY